MKITRGSFIRRFGALIGSISVPWKSGSSKYSTYDKKGIDKLKIRGWNILSDNIEGGLKTIKRSKEYGINHLQISHEIIMDLRHVYDEQRYNVAEVLTKAAHEAGIEEVAFWDHALYDLDYYPEKFKTGPNGTLNLDNPRFWKWLKDDYRKMLEAAPKIEALILTFIETGARVEDQYSKKLQTDAEKLAAVVNTIAEVVIREYNMKIYTRTFAYDKKEYQRITKAVALFEYDDIRLMIKETPHDFFLTHPENSLPGKIDRPTIIEFDAAGEFHGQGIVLNTFPEVFLKRWSDFLNRDHIIGYVARTDRYGSTHIIDRPTEIHLKALQMYEEDRSVIVDDIYKNFITERYNIRAYPMLRAAFENSEAITLATFYSLNINTANHSRLNYDPYRSIYGRHVSGRWLHPPITYVPRGVNKEFHYWKDIINTIAPDWAKKGGARFDEIPQVVIKGWLDEQENMNETYLRYMLTEKEVGIRLSEENLEHIKAARPHLSEEDYNDLYHLSKRTLLTAKLYREVTAAYWGFRIYARGQAYRSDYIVHTLDHALDEMMQIASEVEKYPGPKGQWVWGKDNVEMVRQYYQWITKEGWPKKVHGYPVSFSGQKYT